MVRSSLSIYYPVGLIYGRATVRDGKYLSRYLLEEVSVGLLSGRATFLNMSTKHRIWYNSCPYPYRSTNHQNKLIQSNSHLFETPLIRTISFLSPRTSNNRESTLCARFRSLFKYSLKGRSSEVEWAHKLKINLEKLVPGLLIADLRYLCGQKFAGIMFRWLNISSSRKINLVPRASYLFDVGIATSKR